MSELIDFEWMRAPSGCKLQASTKKTASQILAGDTAAGPIISIRPTGRTRETYRPFDAYPALFKIFSEVKMSESGARDFVGKFGPLVAPGSEPHQESDFGTVSDFKRHLKGFRAALNLWEVGRVEDLVKDFNRSDIGDIGIGLRSNSDEVTTLLRPRSLITGLWLQFALFASANSGLAACENCGDWFVFGSGTGRRNSAKFCGDNCRKANHAAIKKGSKK